MAINAINGIAVDTDSEINGISGVDEVNGLELSGGGAFSPTDIAGLIRWYKSDSLALSDNDPVATWTDEGSDLDDAVQATSGNRPIFKTGIINGKGVVRFDGSDDWLDAAAVVTSAVTLFMVIAPAGGIVTSWNALETENNSSYWRFDDGDGYWGAFRSARINSYPTGVPNTGTNLFTLVSSASTYEARINGVSEGAQSANFYEGSIFRIGANAGGAIAFSGDMAEILVYNSALSGGDIALVETYLRSAARWNF